MVTLTPYLASPPIRLIGRNRRMPHRRPAGRTNCHRRESKVYRMTASHVQVTEARGLRSDQTSASTTTTPHHHFFPNGSEATYLQRSDLTLDRALL